MRTMFCLLAATLAVVAQVPLNDECAGATGGLGVYPNASEVFDPSGATPSADPAGACTPLSGLTDVWHTFTSPIPAAATFWVGTLAPSVLIGVYGAECGSASIACSTAWINGGKGVVYSAAATTVMAGQSFRLRIGFPAGADAYIVYVQYGAPANDDCAGAIEVFDGVNPSPPFGVAGAYFTNVSADDSVISAPQVDNPFSINYGCPFGDFGIHDVFFKYVATCDGAVTFELCPPPGLPLPAPVMADSLMTVYPLSVCGAGPTSAAIGCSDDACGLLSQVQVAVTAGQSVLVRVANWITGDDGAFRLTVRRAGCVEEAGKPGCGASPSAPRLWGTPPYAGASGTLVVAHFDANSPGTIYASLPAAGPTDLSAFSPGCSAYLDVASLIPIKNFTTTSLGRAAATSTVPALPGFLGCTPVWLQAVVVPVDASPAIQLSNQLTMYIGP